MMSSLSEADFKKYLENEIFGKINVLWRKANKIANHPAMKKDKMGYDLYYNAIEVLYNLIGNMITEKLNSAGSYDHKIGLDIFFGVASPINSQMPGYLNKSPLLRELKRFHQKSRLNGLNSASILPEEDIAQMIFDQRDDIWKIAIQKDEKNIRKLDPNNRDEMMPFFLEEVNNFLKNKGHNNFEDLIAKASAREVLSMQGGRCAALVNYQESLLHIKKEEAKAAEGERRMVEIARMIIENKEPNWTLVNRILGRRPNDVIGAPEQFILFKNLIELDLKKHQVGLDDIFSCNSVKNLIRTEGGGRLNMVLNMYEQQKYFEANPQLEARKSKQKTPPAGVHNPGLVTIAFGKENKRGFLDANYEERKKKIKTEMEKVNPDKIGKPQDRKATPQEEEKYKALAKLLSQANTQDDLDKFLQNYDKAKEQSQNKERKGFGFD